MRIRDQDGFGSGALFILVGLGASVLSLGYKIGTPGQMGSGFFPLCLGILLCGLGLILIVQSLAVVGASSRLECWDVRNLVIILLSVIGFAVALPNLGLAAAIIVLVLISSLSRKGLGLLPALVTALVLALGCYLIFVVGLELQLQFLPDFDRG